MKEHIIVIISLILFSCNEIETGARESIGTDFDFIAKAYGFNADVEELIAPREW